MDVGDPENNLSHLRALLGLAQLVHADATLDEVQDAVVTDIAEALGGAAVALHRHRPATDDFVLGAASGAAASAPGPGPASSWSDWDALLASGEAHGEAVWGGGAVYLPLPDPAGGMLGFVAATAPARPDFGLLAVYAGHAALALAALDERRADIRRSGALERLLIVSASARETLEPEPVLEEVCSAVVATLGFASVEVALVTAGSLRTVAGSGGRLDGLTLAEALELLESAAPRQDCLLLPDGSIVLELLDRGGGLKGLMHAQTDASAAPRPADALRLLRTFADQAAGALDSAAQEALRDERDRANWVANNDELTGLPNRAAATRRLADACAGAAANRTTVVAVLIDLEGFSLVNDSLGMAAGDELLRAAATRLAAAAEPDETVARVGGDEFLLITPAAQGGVAALARRVSAALAEPVEVEDMELQLVPTLGIALAPQGNAAPAELLRRADAAVARAKSNGDALAISGGGNDSRRRLTLTTDLRRAIAREELELHYQPIYRVEDGALSSFEALLRWFPKDGDPVPPGEFIPLAETSGLIEVVGEWVLDDACRRSRAWRDAGFDVPPIAVNVSPRQFRRTEVPAIVTRTLATHGLATSALTLEVTEGALQGAGRIEKDLTTLREQGVRIAIDDFGTDYSSLARLNRLPVDMLKIDRAFLRDVPGDPRAARLIAAIVGVADALEMGTVAEGVEHEAQVDFLRRAGATHIQGFLYSRPLPADRAVALLQPVPAGGGEGALATTAIRSRKSGAHIRSATPAS